MVFISCDSVWKSTVNKNYLSLYITEKYIKSFMKLLRVYMVPLTKWRATTSLFHYSVNFQKKGNYSVKIIFKIFSTVWQVSCILITKLRPFSFNQNLFAVQGLFVLLIYICHIVVIYISHDIFGNITYNYIRKIIKKMSNVKNCYIIY